MKKQTKKHSFRRTTVKVTEFVNVTNTIQYDCPHCKLTYKLYMVDYKRVTRFLCVCGHEIIAKYIRTGGVNV